jgi:hypothetical protein
MECNPSGNLKVTRLVSRMNTSHGAGMDFLTVVIGLKACGRDGYLRIGTELHGVVVRLYFSFAPVFKQLEDCSHRGTGNATG